MKAKLKFYLKNRIYDRYVMELSIYLVGVSKAYPDWVRYGLICKDLVTGKMILMDNHHPKGPHININDKEIGYVYENDEKLISDFQSLVFQHLGVKL